MTTCQGIWKKCEKPKDVLPAAEKTYQRPEKLSSSPWEEFVWKSVGFVWGLGSTKTCGQKLQKSRVRVRMKSTAIPKRQ